MKTNVIETGEWERDLEVEVPAERIDKEVNSALQKYRKRLEIPGFRKGKVPVSIVQARYGASTRTNDPGARLALRDMRAVPVHPLSQGRMHTPHRGSQSRGASCARSCPSTLLGTTTTGRTTG